jgi:hypothetical protein
MTGAPSGAPTFSIELITYLKNDFLLIKIAYRRSSSFKKAQIKWPHKPIHRVQHFSAKN